MLSDLTISLTRLGFPVSLSERFFYSQEDKQQQHSINTVKDATLKYWAVKSSEWTKDEGNQES